ncbi:MAG TPA: AraC family transcriptional regulator [Opitutus sp.]|nr:AraC family transcriptional regulator [Opitutus sp.]
MNSSAALQAAAGRLPREDYAVDPPVDRCGQYRLELPADFPLTVKRLSFSARQAPPLTWHTYLELFMPLSGPCRVRMGGGVVELGCGDVLVMDHQKLHAVLDFPGPQAEAVVIRFLPEIVRGAGSAAADHLMLLPFYCQVAEQPHVWRAGERGAAAVQAALAELFASFAGTAAGAYEQTGARAYFLVVLHLLARHFRAAERLNELYARMQTKHGRLREVFEFIEERHAERIMLPEVAARAGLSRPQFHAVFKRAAGMTLVDYVNQVRLTRAARLLQETAQPVVEIANAVGFADQSYFDRRFRRRYGRTPLQFRRGGPAAERIVRKKQAIVLSSRNPIP